ncbi:MAG: hypothetical protein RIC12_01590 [Pirellulales bacterium]
MVNRWQIEIESIEAHYDPDYMSFYPRSVRADLEGSAKLTLRTDHLNKRIEQQFTGNYSGRVWLDTYRDEAGIVEMCGFQIESENYLVLRLLSLAPQQAMVPQAALSASVVGRTLKDAIEVYLVDRFMGQPLSRLLPTIEVQQRLEEQEAELVKSWRLAQLRKRKRKGDEADWWKHGEDPPYEADDDFSC